MRRVRPSESGWVCTNGLDEILGLVNGQGDRLGKAMVALMWPGRVIKVWWVFARTTGATCDTHHYVS